MSFIAFEAEVPDTIHKNASLFWLVFCDQISFLEREQDRLFLFQSSNLCH